MRPMYHHYTPKPPLESASRFQNSTTEPRSERRRLNTASAAVTTLLSSLPATVCSPCRSLSPKA